MKHLIIKYIVLLVCTLPVISSCSSMSISEKESKRNELDNMTATTVVELIKKDPTLQQKINQSLGYAVANMKVTKVPIVGAGGGEGVIVDKQTNHRTYFTVSRFDIGGGWGARSYKVLVIIDEKDILSRLKNGVWEYQAGVEASAGTASAEGSSGSSDGGYTVYVLSDGGASATATARVIRIKVNSNLTD